MLPVRVRRLVGSLVTSACGLGLAVAVAAITGVAAWAATLISMVILCAVVIVLPRGRR
jgi:hypothetical protein